MSRNRIFLSVFIIPVFLIASNIDEAIGLFNSFQFEKARRQFIELLKDETNPRIAEVYYYLGRLSVNPDSALMYYRTLIQKYPQSRWVDISFVEVAKVNIAREHYSDAIIVLNELVRRFPDTELMPEVLFWLGVSELGLENKDEGISTLENLRTSFPKSIWAERAASIIPSKGENKEYFTIQVGSYRNQKYAKIYLEEIKKKGFDAKIVKATIKGNIYYRVWVGQFLKLEEAKTFQSKLDSLDIKGNVVKGY
jgi:tetratricopeptide (TPR) repeat protein